jgi:Flp pilus assembly protein TadD
VWLEMADTRVDALSKALEALEQVASDPGATSEALGLYGRALIKANQPEAAERVLQQAASRFPIDPAVLPRYADVAEQLGHHEAARGALVHYQALVPAGNTLARDAARIARLSMRLNQPVAAALWFQRAAGASPGDMSLMAQLADAQLRAGAREAAKATIDAALAREPGNETFLALSRRF